MDKFSSSFLIANNVEFDTDWPYEIIPGLVLRKPDSDEIPRIQQLVAESCLGNVGWIAPYEMNWISEESDYRASYRSEPIDDQNLWKYWLLHDDEGGDKVIDFDRVLKLVTPAIELAVRLIFSQNKERKISFGHSTIQYQVGERHWGMQKVNHYTSKVGLELLEKLRDLYLRLKEVEENYKFINNALKTFNDLYLVTNYSNLRVVGYFSVIEALITHSPRLTETLDSISHQIRGKMTLLNKRFDIPVDFSAYFCDLSNKTVWSKLYTFRSKVAHGENTDFSKKLSVLKDRETVFNFLENICKSLLRYSLTEPQLLMDLKEC